MELVLTDIGVQWIDAGQVVRVGSIDSAVYTMVRDQPYLGDHRTICEARLGDEGEGKNAKS